MGSSKPIAAVIGGSLTGLITARLLSLAGWDAHIFERVDIDLSGRGAGIGTHPELFDVLRAAAIEIPSDIGINVQLRRVLRRDGSVECDYAYPQFLTSWDRIYTVLRNSVPDCRYHRGMNLQGVTQTPAGVSALFADGTVFNADLMIGADGIRSTVRDVICPEVSPQYVGYIAWRGTVAEDRFSVAARTSMFEYFCFCLPVGEQMAGYPIPRAGERGENAARDYNFIWYRPAAADVLDQLLTDATGKRHEMNIPPPLVDIRHKKRVQMDAVQLLSPQFAEAVSLADNLFCQPIYDLEVPRMVSGRVALLGDAAFVARPHVGAGVTKGFSDAFALTQALKQDPDVEAALKSFEHERYAIGCRILERARHLGAYMQADKNTIAERKAAEKHRRPEAVVRETASLDFLKSASEIRLHR